MIDYYLYSKNDIHHNKVFYNTLLSPLKGNTLLVANFTTNAQQSLLIQTYKKPERKSFRALIVNCDHQITTQRCD